MNLANPHFAEPQWLWLALAGPVAAWLLFRYAARKRQQQLAAFAAPDLLPALLTSHSSGRRTLKHALLAVALVLMAVALARPQWGQTSEAGRVAGRGHRFHSRRLEKYAGSRCAAQPPAAREVCHHGLR
jgi:hypothetical protein